MNEVVKQKDLQIDAIRADYEALKGFIFDRLIKAREEKRYAGYSENYAENRVAMERWTVLKDIIDKANLESEFNTYAEAKKGEQ